MKLNQQLTIDSLSELFSKYIIEEEVAGRWLDIRLHPIDKFDILNIDLRYDIDTGDRVYLSFHDNNGQSWAYPFHSNQLESKQKQYFKDKNKEQWLLFVAQLEALNEVR